MTIFSKIAINRSREGLRCEPMGRYSEKSTYQGSVYLLIGVQERPEAIYAETGGRIFENFAAQPVGWLAEITQPRWRGVRGENIWTQGQNRHSHISVFNSFTEMTPTSADLVWKWARQ